MTVLEMQQLFEILLQIQSPLYNDTDKPDTDTILRFLNLGQVEYIKERYLTLPTFVDIATKLGNNALDLGTLIVRADITFTNDIVDTLTSDNYWHVIKLIGNISRTKPFVVANTAVQFKPINPYDLDRYLTTNINKPLILTPVYTQERSGGGATNSNIIITKDAYTTIEENGVIVYLKKPKTLNLTVDDSVYNTTCELATYLHAEVTRYSVSLFEAEKYKLASKKQDKDK